MRFLILFFGSGSLVSMLLLGGVYVCPELLDELGINLDDVPSVLQNLHDERDRCARLDFQSKDVLGRMAAKEQVVRDVIAGRLTLVQAAARFHHLSDPKTCVWQFVLAATPGNSFDEQLCYHTIDWVKYLLEVDQVPSATRADVLGRLNKELQQELEHGEIRLP